MPSIRPISLMAFFLMTHKIDINADLGEGMANDEALLGIVSSANIACGGHAGSYELMRHTARMALKKGVLIGAHPSFPDRENFGRVSMLLSEAELKKTLLEQIVALDVIVREEGGALFHVKPHGALNNLACQDAGLAKLIARTLHEYNPALILLAPALSQLYQEGKAAGLSVLAEIFADRAYNYEGALLPRHLPGAVIHQPEICAVRVTAMLKQGGIITQSGQFIACPIDSVCVHGDNDEAVETAKAVWAGINSLHQNH
jgi:UPF0271 protein